MGSDCNRAKELMSGAVDDELSAEEYSYFDQHVEFCEICRDEFELEKSTQIYFRSRVGLLEPPSDLLDSIRARLSEEDNSNIIREQLPRISFRRYLWPAVGIAAVLVIAIIAVFTRMPEKGEFEVSQQHPLTTTPQTRDALESAESDFQNLLGGRFNAQVKTHGADEITRFIKENAGYSIPLPTIHNADWIAGSVGALETEKVINVVYKIGASYIYIYAFPTLLAHSKAISLSLECIKALDENKWFWNQSPKGNVQVAWKYQSRVCVATSNLDKRELMAYLKTTKEITDKSWQ
jgi:Putative zinc-finger